MGKNKAMDYKNSFLFKPLVKGRLNSLLIYFCSFIGLGCLILSIGFTYHTSTAEGLLAEGREQNTRGQALQASSKYITPSDSLATAIRQLNPGDTLILGDGVYKQTLGLNNVHGTPDNYITIKAENDGQAIIDGERHLGWDGGRQTMIISNSSYVNIEGIFAKDCFGNDTYTGQCHTVHIWEPSHHINFRRVTAMSGYSARFAISDNPTTHHILFEDCAAYGEGHYGIYIGPANHHITLRRFFSEWKEYYNCGWACNIELYGGYDDIFENVVSFNTSDRDLPCWGTDWSDGQEKWLPVHDFVFPGRNQKLLGSIAVNGKGDSFVLTGTNDSTFENIVSINAINKETNHEGFLINVSRPPFCSASTGNILNNFAWINNDPAARGTAVFGERSDCPGVPGPSLTVKNSFFQGNDSAYAFYKARNDSSILNHSHNRFSSNISNLYYQTSAGENESRLDPNWNTAKYGYGAYLMASKTNLAGQGENGETIGADVLYRYQDGVLTNEPLWPWPMEDRIKAESGISVTWESGGGLWKTLDGVYDTQPSPTLTPYDLNQDGQVDVADFLIFLSHWGSTSFSEGDFDGSGKVDVGDLVLLLGHWGKS